ncbi:PepSY domain-containing protein [Methyloradius palustris]|uniref:PepSY domain-containing protein n=1 Tax=Methyloradius palustris TaxID=2778876 RepID=A0A8D5G7D7_9PROT|nr:PepSY domain-containing protein [Methyloradius palustris]BCM24517.1 hypothetical protein ZMTM_07760 [Methyloradius palustris]
MKYIAMNVCFAALSIVATNVNADDFAFPKTKVSIEKCVQAAWKVHPGELVKSELKVEKKVPIYEFDINGTDGKEWDVECNALSGKITETEEEVKSAEDPLFKPKVKVSEAEAKKTALAAYPGEIVEIEYEVESDGAASYEFDIKLKNGKEMKVEVDATSGKIVEASYEIYQSGKE